MTTFDILNSAMSVASLVASVLAYRQAERAADSAAEAKSESTLAAISARLAAERADEAIKAAREEARSRTFASHLQLGMQLVAEVETLLSNNLLSVAQIRARDLAKQLTYINARFDSGLNPRTITGLVEAKAQMEELALKLKKVQTLTKPEYFRITGIVHRVAETLTMEHAATERREEDGRS